MYTYIQKEITSVLQTCFQYEIISALTHICVSRLLLHFNLIFSSILLPHHKHSFSIILFSSNIHVFFSNTKFRDRQNPGNFFCISATISISLTLLHIVRLNMTFCTQCCHSTSGVRRRETRKLLQVTMTADELNHQNSHRAS